MKAHRQPKNRITTKIQVVVLTAVFFSTSTLGPAYACTGIKIKCQDGAVIFARTAEFGVDLDIKAIGIPAGTKFVGSAPENEPGWRGLRNMQPLAPIPLECHSSRSGG